MNCSLCDKRIEEGNYCDPCAEALDLFFEKATHIAGRNYEEERRGTNPSEFQDDLADSFKCGSVVFDGQHLISVGQFETHYQVV